METAKTKTPALIQAKNALKDYLKKHCLDPTKDWREDKVHGKEVTRLVTRLNLERDKVLDKYPYTDIQNETKFIKMKEKAKAETKAEKAAKKAKKATKEAAPAKEGKKVKKEKTEKAAKAAPTKYDYPRVDGREMTKDEKKKYRAEQRRLANGGEAKPKKEKKAKDAPQEAPAKAPKKKAKKEKAQAPVSEKPLKEKKAKKKEKAKAKKEED